ncbi:MAG: hypothetical protein LBI79_09315 [Nitrososphaerota archaeon]|nr:hypothetical protein [Nitrososphaerota archaeon]
MQAIKAVISVIIGVAAGVLGRLILIAIVPSLFATHIIRSYSLVIPITILAAALSYKFLTGKGSALFSKDAV